MEINTVKKKKRFSITLIEMVIVMILITMITGAIAYNYRESLNEGRAFKTKEGIERIKTIITLYLAEHPEDQSQYQTRNWKDIVAMHPLMKGSKNFLTDGWGDAYEIRVEKDSDDELQAYVSSKNYEKYEKRKHQN
jgi:general secretion pathway protein G